MANCHNVIVKFLLAVGFCQTALTSNTLGSICKGLQATPCTHKWTRHAESIVFRYQPPLTPSRQLIIKVCNSLPMELMGTNPHLEYGVRKATFPASIYENQCDVGVVRKAHYTATGITGVITYNIWKGRYIYRGPFRQPIFRRTHPIGAFAIEFNVPYNYLHSSNWFSVKWIARVASSQPSNSALFEKLNGGPSWFTPNIGKAVDDTDSYEMEPTCSTKAFVQNTCQVNLGRFTVSASMDDMEHATLNVEAWFNSTGMLLPVQLN